MYNTLTAIEELLNGDEMLIGANCRTTMITADPLKSELNVLRPISLTILPRGNSQTASAGPLSDVVYFSLALRWNLIAFKKGNKDFALPYRIIDTVVNLLHRRRFAERSVIFNKSMISESDLTVTVNERRYYVTVPKGEMAALMFFWASKLSLASLESASGGDASVSGDTSGGFVAGMLGVPNVDGEDLPPDTDSGESSDLGSSGAILNGLASKHVDFGRILM